jgi:sterol 3beta-glucosyltransferase
MIIVAHVADQFFWGPELERLGCAGRTLGRKGLQADNLADGIHRVQRNPAMARSAADLGWQMATEDGVSEAVRLIEQKLPGRC